MYSITNYTVENKDLRNYRTTVKQGKQLLSTLGISHSVRSTIKKGEVQFCPKYSHKQASL